MERAKCERIVAEAQERLADADETQQQPTPSVDAELLSAIQSLLRESEAKRDAFTESLERTQLALHKFVKAEEAADRQKTQLERAKAQANSPEDAIDLREAEQQLNVRGEYF